MAKYTSVLKCTQDVHHDMLDFEIIRYKFKKKKKKNDSNTNKVVRDLGSSPTAEQHPRHHEISVSWVSGLLLLVNRRKHFILNFFLTHRKHFKKYMRTP